jgi:arginase family enzyme
MLMAAIISSIRLREVSFVPVAVLHVDSHTDCHPVNPDYPYDAASQFSHTALEQRISPGASYHVGIRGSTYRPGVMDHTRSLGYNVITMREYMRRGEADVLAELHEALKARPVYLSWDMDSFDVSVAPGVCTPTWGGFTAREGLQLLRGLDGLNIVAIDINTVSPPHDVNGMSAHLATQVAFECMLLLDAHIPPQAGVGWNRCPARSSSAAAHAHRGASRSRNTSRRSMRSRGLRCCAARLPKCMTLSDRARE